MTASGAFSSNSPVTNVDVLIVGAGFSGICMGIKLLEAGMQSFLIIEKGEEIGGIVPHITLKSIAKDEPPEEEVLVDRPEVKSGTIRVTGPFTFEATIPTPVDWEGDSGADFSPLHRPDGRECRGGLATHRWQ